MRRYKLAAIILIGLTAIGINMASFKVANAATVYPFETTGTDNTGTIQSWVVPTTGTYTIDSYGAAGKSGNCYSGGYGGRAKGDFILTAGTTLSILVGQSPNTCATMFYAGGGGGGTFVVTSTGTPLIIAGGGGGGGGTIEGSRWGGTGGSGGDILSPVGYTESSALQSYGDGDGGGGGYALGGYGYFDGIAGYGEGGRSFTAGGAGGYMYPDNEGLAGCGGFGGRRRRLGSWWWRRRCPRR